LFLFGLRPKVLEYSAAGDFLATIKKGGLEMTNWDRKEADLLADAIVKHITHHSGREDDNRKLLAIERDADAAANTIATTAGVLTGLRSRVCTICRGSKLYPCDVPSGWSSRCAFILSNTTQFGELGD
jgi:hypothetical protein